MKYRATAKQLELVVVLWEDAAFGTDDDTLENIRHEVSVNHTAGWLVKKTKKVVGLVTEVAPADGTVRWTYTIPRRLVRGIIYTGVLACHQSTSQEQPQSQQPSEKSV